MNIAIADDDLADVQAEADFLHSYIMTHYPEVSVGLKLETFSCAGDILRAFSPGRYDLILLDIYMGDMTGIDIAEIIRKTDDRVKIIFVTTSTEHLLAGYRVFAAGYFIKPLVDNKSDFAKTFDFIFPQLTDGQNKISVPVKGGVLDIPYRDIVYIDINVKHQLCLHLTGEDVISSLRYENCRSELIADPRFLECHHRILINMDKVIRMDKNSFMLFNNTTVPMSIRRQKEAKLTYMQYLVRGTRRNNG